MGEEEEEAPRGQIEPPQWQWCISSHECTMQPEETLSKVYLSIIHPPCLSISIYHYLTTQFSFSPLCETLCQPTGQAFVTFELHESILGINKGLLQLTHAWQATKTGQLSEDAGL